MRIKCPGLLVLNFCAAIGLGQSILRSIEDYEAELTSRMGLAPNFFAPLGSASEPVEALWAFAKAAYLDSPLPSPFKDRLFIYLSRFCEIRYCIARHCAFLIAADPADVEGGLRQLAGLLTKKTPWERDLSSELAELASQANAGWPEPDTRDEDLVIAAATSIFIEPRGSEGARGALEIRLGTAGCEQLLAFLTFARSAHFWTLVHPELRFEDDVQQLLLAHPDLAELILNDPEAGRSDMSVRLFEELTELRGLHEQHALEQTREALEVQLSQKEDLLSELQAVQRELALKDERLQMALTASGVVGLWDWVVETDLLHGDASFARLYGLEPARTATGLTMEQYQEFVVAEDIAPLRERIRAVFDRGEDFLVEYRLAVPGAPLRWVECKGRMIKAPDGKPLRFSGTAIDVTERKQAERALQESESRLRFLRALDERLQAEADAPSAMKAAAELLALRIGASRCAYADVDADSDRFVIRDDYSAAGIASSAGVYSLDLFGSRAVADMRGGRVLVVRDVASELAPADGRDMFQSIGIDAIVCCPLIKDGRLVAMMAVHQNQPRDWRDDEISLVEATVERCWAHVQRIGAEARLRESEERYRTLFEAVDAGFAIAEVRLPSEDGPTDYRLLEMNPAFQRHTGMSKLEGRWLREAIPDLEDHWFEAYGRVAATGEPIRFENGAESIGRWFDVHAFRMGAPEDRLVAILFNDISERKRSEEALRRLNESLEGQVADRTAELRFSRDIIEAPTSAICAFDTEHRLIAFNKAHRDEFRRVHGYDCNLGDVLPDLLIPEQRDRMRILMDRALSGERFTAVEVFGRPELGQPYWELSYTPLRSADGAIIGAFHVAEDISDRRRAETDLAAAQDALRQSQKMEAMGSLTGGVAHDFNNLLTPIIGSLDMLQRKRIGGEREQLLIEGALQSAERAKTLVQRLLAFARRQPLQPRAVDLNALISGMADLIASTSGPQTRVVVDAPTDLPAALADQNQLEMAILNLSVNARDAMPNGGRLSISARACDIASGHATGLAPGRYVRLSVADTGVGMDAATLRRSIEPFYSTKGIGKGTGLGLSMVHGLAAQLGGALTIDSRPGLGTDVQLWLPVTNERAGVVEVVADTVINAGVGCAMLVDDEDVVRTSTADMLTDLGYKVVQATSAEDALRLLDEGVVPNLLVTDHLMPGKNGTDLAREVLQRLPDVGVLIVSGYADADGIAPDLPRLVKPFRQAELAAIIAEQVS